MSRPFEIELHLVGGRVIRFDLSEEDVRERALWPENHRALAELNADAPDERTRLRRAAYQVVLRVVEEFQVTARAHPISTAEADGAWIRPNETLEAAHLRDPDAGADRDAFGWVERPVSNPGAGG
jgi:hypothetical protein